MGLLLPLAPLAPLAQLVRLLLLAPLAQLVLPLSPEQSRMSFRDYQLGYLLLPDINFHH